MEIKKIREDMMKLWKETFHDSDDYIDLIFSQYFNINHIEYYYEEDRLISALLAIPYKFKYGNAYIDALYLCGLATRVEFRNQGIMNQLIERINSRAQKEGIVISFLIPASDTLRIYYQNKGYHNGMFRIEEKYTEIHDFEKDFFSEISTEDKNIRLLKSDYFQNLSVKILDDKNENDRLKLIRFIRENELKNRNYSLLIHTENDLETIITENKISGGKIYYGIDYKGEIKGCAFLTFKKNIRVTIAKIYNDDIYIYYKILNQVKKDYSNLPISVFRFPEEVKRRAIWGINYIENSEKNSSEVRLISTDGVYDFSSHSIPYGMIKILNFKEILKFIASIGKDKRFSILMKGKSNTIIKVLFENGKVNIVPIQATEAGPNDIVLSEEDLSALLFRKKDSSSIITETIQIPRLSLNMALLLD